MATRVRNVSGASGAIVVHGIKPFRRDLQAAIGSIRDMRLVNREVGMIVVAEAKSRAVTGPSKQGHIANTLRPYATTKKAGISYGSARNPYPFAREFGWKSRPYTAGPIIYPAIATKGKEIIERYGEFIDRVFDHAYPSRSSTGRGYDPNDSSSGPLQSLSFGPGGATGF